ncbi:MAG: helix-turn-helix domain-containing protein [Leptolyngbyaceae cyanobacterium]
MNKTVDFRDALNEVLRQYDIKANDLAARSGIDEVQISKFRNKHKNMQTQNFERLIAALPQNARMYFWYLVMAENTNSHQVAEEGGNYSVASKSG